MITCCDYKFVVVVSAVAVVIVIVNNCCCCYHCIHYFAGEMTTIRKFKNFVSVHATTSSVTCFHNYSRKKQWEMIIILLFLLWAPFSLLLVSLSLFIVVVVVINTKHTSFFPSVLVVKCRKGDKKRFFRGFELNTQIRVCIDEIWERKREERGMREKERKRNKGMGESIKQPRKKKHSVNKTKSLLEAEIICAFFFGIGDIARASNSNCSSANSFLFCFEELGEQKKISEKNPWRKKTEKI